jgi:hypothetical protein
MKRTSTNVLLAALIVVSISMVATGTENPLPQGRTSALVSTADKPQHFEGWVSDEKCGTKVNIECARKCAAAGVKVVFVDANQKIVPVANQDSLKGFAGQHVSIRGKLDNGVLKVDSVKAIPDSK